MLPGSNDTVPSNVWVVSRTPVCVRRTAVNVPCQPAAGTGLVGVGLVGVAGVGLVLVGLVGLDPVVPPPQAVSRTREPSASDKRLMMSSPQGYAARSGPRDHQVRRDARALDF